MPKKPEPIARLIRQMRATSAPSIDGSYVLMCKLPSAEYAQAAHPAYTPAQIEAERKVKGMNIAAVVYFIRDEQMPAPYWVSPYRQAIRSIDVRKGESGETVSLRIPHVVFTVAPSRDARKEHCAEVAIAAPVLQSLKGEKRAEYVLEQLRKAVAFVMQPEEVAA